MSEKKCGCQTTEYPFWNKLDHVDGVSYCSVCNYAYGPPKKLQRKQDSPGQETIQCKQETLPSVPTREYSKNEKIAVAMWDHAMEYCRKLDLSPDSQVYHAFMAGAQALHNARLELTTESSSNKTEMPGWFEKLAMGHKIDWLEFQNRELQAENERLKSIKWGSKWDLKKQSEVDVAHLKSEPSKAELYADNDRLNEQLNFAKKIIHDEFCGSDHHNFCKVLKKGWSEVGDE